MTADPEAVRTAYVIPEMTYREAMELCNFGSKLIYSPALYPIHKKNIPLIVKNFHNPDGCGTKITDKACCGERAIRGISSIDDVSLITLTGTSLAGIVGVDCRVFTALALERISAFMVTQSASETGVSIGVSRQDAEKAKAVLDGAFYKEISNGSVLPIKVQNDLAAVSVIGDNMKGVTGIAGKLFSALGHDGINIIALVQDATESNISFVVEREQLHKALNVIHDSFFLSEYQELNLFICGIGVVGGQLLEQIASQREKLMKDRNLKINVVGIARSVKGIFNRDGIDLSDCKEALKNGIDLTPEKLKDEVIGMNIFNSVFVDCTASEKVAALYEDFFNHGISVVAANKIAASSDYPKYRNLKDTARRRGAKFLFETNVGAGLPIIGTINDLCNSGDRILKMEAVLSGTLNFIFNTISSEIPFSKAVLMAKEQGFSEPDPRIDLSGKDVIRKLVILSREAGYVISQEDVEADLFIPADFFNCSLEEFWKKLPSLDAKFEEGRRRLEAEGKRWRFVAENDNGKCSVSLQEIPMHHSFYVLDGSNNIILLTTERYNKHPMLIQGYGAGASVTAAGVFADIMSIANIR
jgi:Homoserine dehydrogenase